MRVLVCGDRDWFDDEYLYMRLREVDEAAFELRGRSIQTIIHGDARGADKMGGQWGVDNNKEVLVFPAQWDLYGKSAGPIRNQQMLDEGKPDLILAFNSKIGSSKGTWDMIKRANQIGLEVRLYG